MRKLEASLLSLRSAALEYTASRGKGSGQSVATAAQHVVVTERSASSVAAPQARRLMQRVVARLRAMRRKLTSWW